MYPLLNCKLLECGAYVDFRSESTIICSIRLLYSTGLLNVCSMHEERNEGRLLFAFETRVIVTIINLLFSSAFRILVYHLPSHGNEKWGGGGERRKKKTNMVSLTV